VSGLTAQQKGPRQFNKSGPMWTSFQGLSGHQQWRRRRHPVFHLCRHCRI